LKNLKWDRVELNEMNIRVFRTVLPISESLPEGASINSLFSAENGENHKRYTLARHPNMDDIEKDMWGYYSPEKNEVSFNLDTVVEWKKPIKSAPPDTFTIDLQSSNPSGMLKNNSEMTKYNWYTTGSGNSCESVWDASSFDENGGSYWCSVDAAGGWAEVDASAAQEGQPQIPIGLNLNMSNPFYQKLKEFSNVKDAVIHAWHSQTWAVHMFPVNSFDVENGKILFKNGGGSQGARNWCRCDQCNYAGNLWSDHGNWCQTDTDDRLIGGNWFIEGIFSALDHPNEFFYNSSTRELFLAINATDTDGFQQQQPPSSLIVPILKVLISLNTSTHVQPIHDVTFQNIGFRDSLSTYRDKWAVPSGGDWAMHRSAAFFIENSINVTVSRCIFRRLDGNALLLAGFNRNTLIRKSSFEFIGQNAAAAWGNTTNGGWNGTNGLQPRQTHIEQCWFHDIGLFQKQSSAWFQAKSALTTIQHNVMFNLPRAAINFNDGFGGGNLVQQNIIFNTCRESGDHGPINSWDRMPFFTDISSENGSFDPLFNTITRNLIFANYGASWAVDNDDGSSFYNIFNNVFIDSNGLKMDYGGHNTHYHQNIVLSKYINTETHPATCIDTESFLYGITDSFYNNSCYVQSEVLLSDLIGHVESCDLGFFSSHDNVYYTKNGEASLLCGTKIISVVDLANKTGIGQQDIVRTLPNDYLLQKIITNKMFEIFQ